MRAVSSSNSMGAAELLQPTVAPALSASIPSSTLRMFPSPSAPIVETGAVLRGGRLVHVFAIAAEARACDVLRPGEERVAATLEEVLGHALEQGAEGRAIDRRHRHPVALPGQARGGLRLEAVALVQH